MYHHNNYEEFNLHFGYPNSDTCATCERFRIQLNSPSLTEGCQEKIDLPQGREDHLRSAEGFYSSLRLNTELAKKNDHISTISFDFQQNLPLPHLPVFYTCNNRGFTFLEYIVAATTKCLCTAGQRVQRSEEAMRSSHA